MQIAPVNYDHLVAPFDYLVITRAQRAGRVDRLRVTKRFKVRVDRHDGSVSRFELDAAEAEDLVHALAHAVDAAPRTAPATSPWIFDVELGWHGSSVRLRGLALPQDEAVSGVLQFAQRVFNGNDVPMTGRRLATLSE